MTKNIEQFVTSANTLTLSKGERADARAFLEAKIRFPHAMGALSAAAHAYILSPDEKMLTKVQLTEAMYEAGESGARWSLLSFSSFSRIVSTITASFFIVVMSGGVLTYAAESALPGDVLYPVKVSLNEPVIELLQRTPQEKAVWAAKRFERRLSEARILVEKATVERQRTKSNAAERQQETESVPALLPLRSSESASVSEALTVKAKVKQKTTSSANPKAPEPENGMTEKQDHALEELVNAGVPEIKINSWVKALRGEKKHSSSASIEETENDDASSTSSASAKSSRSSVSKTKKKNILPEILESGFVIPSSSAKSRKNKHSSSSSSSSLSSSRDESTSSSESSSVSSGSSKHSSSTSSSSAAVSVSSSVSTASSIGTSSSADILPLPPPVVPPAPPPPPVSIPPAIGNGLGL